MPLDLQPEHLATVGSILRQHVPGREVWVFGSRMHGTATSTSDLDLAVVTDEPLDLAALAAMKDAFSASALPMKVDVTETAAMSEGFRQLVEREHVVIQSASDQETAAV